MVEVVKEVEAVDKVDDVIVCCVMDSEFGGNSLS